jgi:hypothetical protein
VIFAEIMQVCFAVAVCSPSLFIMYHVISPSLIHKSATASHIHTNNGENVMVG